MTPATGERVSRTGSPDVPIQVLGKADSILRALVEHGPMGVAQLAETVGEPRSSIYRLLNSLSILGWVEGEPDQGTYALGIKLFRIGRAAVSRLDVRAAALPAMRRLHAAAGETVFLCVRRGLDAVCIERLDGRRVQSLALQLGGALPLHAGAGPRVLLAYADSEVKRSWAETADRGLQAFTDRTPTSRDVVERLLQDIRARGVSVSDGDVTPGIAALGTPIFDYDGVCVAALSTSGIRNGILGPNADLTAATIAAAAEASRAMGHVTDDPEARTNG